MGRATRSRAVADDLSRVIDCSRETARAGERHTEIDHRAVAPKERMDRIARGQRFTHHLASVVDAIGHALHATERAEVCDRVPRTDIDGRVRVFDRVFFR
jgi:hypothetical protein